MAPSAAVKDVLTSAQPGECKANASWGDGVEPECLKYLKLKPKKHCTETIALRNGVAIWVDKNSRIQEKSTIYQRDTALQPLLKNPVVED